MVSPGCVDRSNHYFRAMLHDEEVYPDPSSFRPERFLDENGQINRELRHPGEMAFGFGRRYVFIKLSCWVAYPLTISYLGIAPGNT